MYYTTASVRSQAVRLPLKEVKPEIRVLVGACVPRRRTKTKEVDPQSKMLGDHLLSLRNRLGLTQEDVAAKLGVTPSAYQHYEKGRNEPRFTDAPKLAHVLGVSPGELFDPLAVPAAFAQAFELEGIDRMLSDYTKLQDLSPYESAIVADLVDSLKRHRDQPSQ